MPSKDAVGSLLVSVIKISLLLTKCKQSEGVHVVVVLQLFSVLGRLVKKTKASDTKKNKDHC